MRSTSNLPLLYDFEIYFKIQIRLDLESLLPHGRRNGRQHLHHQIIRRHFTFRDGRRRGVRCVEACRWNRAGAQEAPRG